MKLHEYSAVKLAQMVKAKEVSAKELTEASYKRIEETDEKVKAFISLNKEDALKKAEGIDQKLAAEGVLSPLAGVPVAVKDNINVKGVITTCGSKILENYVAEYDATVTKKLQESGGVIIGKANMDEFAMGSSTELSAFGVTHNPVDLARVPGGSSGGSAASVASGQVSVALGTDTGGSVRQPASFCGIVGLKPTYGSVSRYGVVAYGSSLDQVGMMGKTVEDAAFLFSAVAGKDKMDATSQHALEPEFSSLLTQKPKELVIGVPKEYFGEGITEEVKASVLAAVKEMEQAGAKIKEISLPNTEYALSAYYIIACAEASSNLAKFDGVLYGKRAEEYGNLNDLFVKTRTEGFGDEVQKRIMIGTYVLSSGFYDAYYHKAKLTQQLIRQEVAVAFQECDVIVTPTLPYTSFEIGKKMDDPLQLYAADICTVTVNITGLPAMSVPCGKDSLGLPIGLQMIGPKFSEAKLLSTGHWYEQVRGKFENKLMV